MPPCSLLDGGVTADVPVLVIVTANDPQKPARVTLIAYESSGADFPQAAQVLGSPDHDGFAIKLASNTAIR